MSREPKKKPGEMARKRAIHKQNQERRDALAKLREGESIEVWAHYERGSAKVTVKPYSPKSGDNVLCLFSRRLRVMKCGQKRGNHWTVFDSVNNNDIAERCGVIPPDQVFGVVTEILEIKTTKE